MELKYKNYKLVKDGDRFDIHKTVQSLDKKTGKLKYVDRVEGYSMRLDAAIVWLSHDIIDKEDITELREYVSMYINTIENIRNNLGIRKSDN